MSRIILGIHETTDASAALMIDGTIVAAAQEERFTGLKSDYGYPKHARLFDDLWANELTPHSQRVSLSKDHPCNKEISMAADDITTSLGLPEYREEQHSDFLILQRDFNVV